MKKFSVSRFQKLLELKKEVYCAMKESQRTNDYITEATVSDRIKHYEDLIAEFPTVNVQFCIGSRQYFRVVQKIGKSYFTNGQKMTKGAGFVSIEEISKITESMKGQMVADSYYY